MDNSNSLKQLKEENQALHKEIFLLKNVIDNLPGSIYWKDADGRYLGRNLYSAERMYEVHLEPEINRNAVKGKTDYDYFDKEIADRYRENDLEVMRNGKESRMEEVAKTLSDGSQIVQLSIKRPLRDEQGKIIGIVGNTVDISYLKKIEKKLILAKKDAAEAASKAKTEFIQNMEHDIRTPFNGIWGLANFLLEHETDAQKHETLKYIVQSAKQLLDYCNDVLYFSKVEKGTLAIFYKKFELSKLLGKLFKMEEAAAKTKHLNLAFNYDKTIPEVLIGDYSRLFRILLNLVSNAIKFTKEGHISLQVNIAQRNRKNIILEFVLEDTGIGISKEQQGIIYEKFSRITPSNKGLYKGTGLGLKIVRRFLDDMDGEIEIQSEIGKGSIFRILLPFQIHLLHREESHLKA